MDIQEVKGIITILMACSIGMVIGEILGELAVFIIKRFKLLCKKVKDRNEVELDYIGRMELELEELEGKLDKLEDMREYHTSKGIWLTRRQLELLDKQVEYMKGYILTLMTRIREEKKMRESERELGKQIINGEKIK